ncbi:protein strawberry notch homolog 1 [Parasteatoda tepidariorum]|uniref:protein strawberry notch homolog 1 n=1 Tax=Parasteatoda tepidariorum TaxID=114398 RepID=UPI00077FC4DF|nr:protein strawberry notch homolog 1 [Parasteatoda tepidariorum]XP_015914781.1 protein strawberry notch homolog 1 [Parasteatoda tepidariorum]XP_042906794.1 protein strawberry notch homolog 1 [Parasteatoda tepidariorum]
MMESPDLLSAALDESGIKPENDQTFNEKDFSSTKSLPKQSHLEQYMHQMPQMSNHWPNSGGFPFNAATMMDYARFPFMDKSMASMMRPEMFSAAAMQMALQSQMMNGFPGMPYGLTSKDINPYYMNGDHLLRQMMMTGGTMQPRPEHEEGEDEEEELGRAETYADYMPSKLKIGIRHPDPVVETSSLSSVQPPDTWYKLSIPEEVIDRGLLSALQLEAITYACQQHETILPDGTRAGFLIGDGAGVGKGRTLAGVIYENYLLGRKRAIWLSVSNDLKYDAERDLKDIGAGKIEVHALNKFKYAKISCKANGSVKKGVIFATYSSLIGESQSGGKYKTRLKQLLHWCGDDFDGCIVFDECHKAKNLCPAGSSKPTKTGLTVLDLQNKLPKARVVYASATGASEPKNMAYMTRLGLWGEGTPFKEFNDFISVVEKRGVGAMELVAMDMKLRGLYMARQLSFAGVSFKIEEIPLAQDFISMYNESVKIWVEARAKFQEAAELMEGDPRTKKTMWCQFWASHQRFFKYLCIASKVRYVVQLSREAVKNGKCVVIGLQSTGEARTLEQLEEAGGELSDFVSTAKGVFQSLVEKQFPAPDHKKTMRLLGLDLQQAGSSSASPSASTSSGKRKPLRRARQGVKRYREYKLSDESSSAEDYIPSGGSDFEPSGDESPAVESGDDNAGSGSDSERESDFNPFDDESDSDGPWANRKKAKKDKGKKRKNKGIISSKKHKQPPKPLPPLDAVEKASAMKASLLEKIERLGDLLPPNTLDQLIDDLGGPENVAEMTGRKGRVVSNDGTIQYESRSEADAPLETLNMVEKQRFMDGEKHIAIISEAASSGISLQSDRRVKNQARRVHITLELPWSADKAIQQFGRTHRSNQVNAPEYVFVISDLAGERRFASIVAKRLESLGALTHGDRRATESRDLSQFNIDTKYGRTALETAMRAVMEYEVPLVSPPTDYKGNFFYDVRKSLAGVAMITEDPMNGYQFLEKDYNNMSKFMNRILGLPVDLQNRLFQYFTDTLDAVIAQAKKAGRYDLGILDLGTGGDQVKREKVDMFMQKHATGIAKTELHTVLVERGLSWEQVLEKIEDCSDKDEGFYLSAQARNNRKTAILAVADTGRTKGGNKGKLFRVYRPNTGLQAKQETLDELKSKYHKCTKKEVEEHWKENYEQSGELCSHMYWYGQCRRQTMGVKCEVGLRKRRYFVLSGSVLSVWTKIESIFPVHGGSHNAKLQVVRLKTEDSARIVGCLIPSNVVEVLKKVLAEDAAEVDEKEFDDVDEDDEKD